MTDNKDLKSKILLMRQKNLGEVINESNEKNDNEKPENVELNHNEVNIETDKELTYNKENLLNPGFIVK